MTSAIEKATNSIYIKLTEQSQWSLPIKSIDGVRCDCDLFNFRHDFSLLITILDTEIIAYNVDYTSICEFYDDESKTKNIISNMLRDLTQLKFNKLKNMFEIPTKDRVVVPEPDIFELFKDEKNIKLRIETCPCCLELCNWSLLTCGHSICPPCFQKLPNTPFDGKDNKTCPTCRGPCIKNVDE